MLGWPRKLGGTDATIDGGIDSATDDVTTIDVVTLEDSGADVVNDDTGTTDGGSDATDGGATIDSGPIKTRSPLDDFFASACTPISAPSFCQPARARAPPSPTS